MRRPSLRKPSFRDHLGEVNRAMRGQETMFGDLREAKGIAKPLIHDLAPPREVVNRSDPNELEGAVLAEVGEVLAVHPNVIMCVRQNTGAAQMLGKNGRTYPVWFYRWIRRAENMTITDYWGWLRIGPSRVPFALECKRRSWKRNFNKADENEQHTFIEEMIRMGGRGGFVTSAEQALKILS